MNKGFNKNAQGGFTLIELIVVIVILGILAATALPKFANLGADARVATLNAAKGAMTSQAAMVHGKWLIDNTATTMNIEGTTVNIVNGYPKADTAFATAAGLNSEDYTITQGTNMITIVPKGVGSDVADTCFITYTEVTASGGVPVYGKHTNGIKCE